MFFAVAANSAADPVVALSVLGADRQNGINEGCLNLIGPTTRPLYERLGELGVDRVQQTVDFVWGHDPMMRHALSHGPVGKPITTLDGMRPLTDSDPAFTNETERLVWRRVVKASDYGEVVLANLRLTDEVKDHEIDLLVLLPDVGIVVVEVKGGSVSIDHDGQWWQSGGSGRHKIHPVDQARDAKYAAQLYVESDPRWRDSSRTRVRWAHCVVTPYTDIDEDFATPDCPRHAIHGRADMDDLMTRLREAAASQDTGHRTPTVEDLLLIREILRGRNLPAPCLLARVEEREAAADRLTQEQALLLRGLGCCAGWKFVAAPVVGRRSWR